MGKSLEDEYLAQKVAYAIAREGCATEVEIYTHLVDVAGPNLKSSYMMLIGRFEYRLFRLTLDARRWKRRIELRQIAFNADETPDLAAIEAKVEAEFGDYLAELKAREAELNAARGHFHCGRLTDSENTQLRVTYLDAVKRLHPDLNPDLPERAKMLWAQVQKAYKNRDFEQLKFLSGIVGEVVGGERAFEKSREGVDALTAEVKRLKEKTKEVRAKIAALRKEQPYCYEDFLADSDEVETRQKALQSEIEAMEGRIEEYERSWNNG